MTEMLTDVIDGAILELQPKYLRKRLRAMRYGSGNHVTKTRHGGVLGIAFCFAVGLTMLALAM